MDHINPSEIALVGITHIPKWYKGPLKSIKHTDKIRGDLILYSARFASGIGYRVVIVDSLSAKTFHQELKGIYGARIIKVAHPKRSPNRRKAIYEASNISGVRVLVMTEIEKVSLVTDCMTEIVRPVLEGNVDIVVPKREDSLFKKTYPLYMYESEVEANLLYNEELRANGLLSVHDEDLDFFFGARVFKNDKVLLKKILSKYNSNTFDSLSANKLFDLEEYSDAQFFPIVKALSSKIKVLSVTVPFRYPEKQKENEESGERELFMLKRKYQRLTILIELMHFIGYLQKKKTRKITKLQSL